MEILDVGFPPSNIQDIRGIKFGRLTPVAFAGKKEVGKVFKKTVVWLCQCECGKLTYAFRNSLFSGNTTSCGCFRAEKQSTLNGLTKHPLFKRWKGMVDRCTNPKKANYQGYGARGITVCERWRKFENFVADMGHPALYSLSIHRIDNDGPYCPENCKWADASEQARFRRTSRMITLNGETKNQSQWAVIFGVRPSTIARRRSLGWSDELALTQPVRPIRHTQWSS